MVTTVVISLASEIAKKNAKATGQAAFRRVELRDRVRDAYGSLKESAIRNAILHLRNRQLLLPVDCETQDDENPLLMVSPHLQLLGLVDAEGKSRGAVLLGGVTKAQVRALTPVEQTALSASPTIEFKRLSA